MGLEGFLKGLLEHIPVAGSRVEIGLLLGCASSQLQGFLGKKKKKRIVVECLVDLEVNLRKQEQSAAPYI